jgi:hypothetical protein
MASYHDGFDISEGVGTPKAIRQGFGNLRAERLDLLSHCPADIDNGGNTSHAKLLSFKVAHSLHKVRHDI